MAVSNIWQSYSSSNLHWIYPLYTNNCSQNVKSSFTAEILLKRRCNDIQDILNERMIELLLQGACDPNKQQNYLQGMSPSRKKKTHVKKFLKKQKKIKETNHSGAWLLVRTRDSTFRKFCRNQRFERYQVPAPRHKTWCPSKTRGEVCMSASYPLSKSTSSV